MTPKISYLICATPRTGSWLLSEGLRETGVCGVPREYFRDLNKDAKTRVLSSLDRVMEAYLPSVLEKGTTPNGVFGAKIHWVDFEHLTRLLRNVDRCKGRSLPEMVDVVFPNVRYIHIRRRNKVRQAISLEKAFQSNIWKMPVGEASPKRPRFKYNYFSLYDLCRTMMREDAAWEEYFLRYSIRPLEVFYEDMTGAYKETLGKVLQFLQIEDAGGREIPQMTCRRLSDEINESWHRKYRRTPIWLGKSYTAWKLMRKKPSIFLKRLTDKFSSHPKKRLLFVSTSYFYPESVGGSELSHLHLLKNLKKRGWDIEVVCTSQRGSSVDESSSFLRHALCATPERFEAFIHRRIKKFRPDAVLGHEGGPVGWQPLRLLGAIAARGYPTFCFVHNVDNLESIGAGIRALSKIRFVANSPFTDQTLRSYFQNPDNVKTILPCDDWTKYKARSRSPRYITFINPVQPKGLAVVLEIAARMPHERFLFVRSRWATLLRMNKEDQLTGKIEKMPNIDVWDVQEDMSRVYAVTDILLMPSHFMETFGRVIVEAHVNGIPVVASNVCGIPYTMGKGGILVDPKDDAEQYVAALESLKKDRNLYDWFSGEALQNSQRPEFDPGYQFDQFVAYVEAHCRTYMSRPRLTRVLMHLKEDIKDYFQLRVLNERRFQRRSKLYRTVFRLFGPEIAERFALIYTSFLSERVRSHAREMFK